MIAIFRRQRLRVSLARGAPLFYAVVAFAVVLLVMTTRSGRAFEDQASLRLAYQMREDLGKAPSINDRLKIFAYDDKSVKALRTMELGLDDWAKIFRALDRQNPAAILVDKIFDRPYSDAEIAAFRSAMEGVRTPVTTLAFAINVPVFGRDSLNLEQAAFSGPAYVDGHGALPEDLKIQGGLAYAAAQNLASIFKQGHALYSGDGRVRPIYRLDANHILPHWSLTVANDSRFTAGQLRVNGLKVPVDDEGRVLVDFSPRADYAKRAISMLPLILDARAGRGVKVVSPGDFVVLLPSMYTGNTDWKETPLGTMPGGYVMVAMLNSVLRGEWLSGRGDAWILAAFGAVIGALLAASFGALWFWPSLAIALGLTFVAAAAAFSYGAHYVSWMPSAAALVAAALSGYAGRERHRQFEKVRMERELETARLVQISFFPPEGEAAAKTQPNGFNIEGFFHPASECGGDWWGHFSPRPGELCVLIGDATGHGVAAALVTAMAFSAARLWATEQRLANGVTSPAAFLTRLDSLLGESGNLEASMTFFAATIDRNQGTITYANAGHNFPFLLRAKEEVNRSGKSTRVLKLTARPGPVLGFGTTGEDEIYRDYTDRFGPGDKLFFFTDGLIENVDAEGKSWGLTLQKRLAAMAGLGARAICAAIKRESEEFRGAEPRRDDVTVVVVESLA